TGPSDGVSTSSSTANISRRPAVRVAQQNPIQFQTTLLAISPPPRPILPPSRRAMATVARTLVAACPARSLLRLRSRRLPSSSSIRPARQRAGVGSVRCMARRPDSSYSPLRSGQGGDRAPTEMAPLFPGCDYEHWLIVMDKPGGEGATKQQMIDCYIQTLAQVLGSEEEAKKKIYNVSCERYFGFGCEIDEETSNKLEGDLFGSLLKRKYMHNMED
ncbi:Multiple organellar RNA editing factor 5, mitochondrial, partial [Zea mays]